MLYYLIQCLCYATYCIALEMEEINYLYLYLYLYFVQMKGFLPWWVRWDCRAGTRYFCSALAALVSPVQNDVFLTVHYFDSFYPSPSKVGMQPCWVACLFLCVSGNTPLDVVQATTPANEHTEKYATTNQRNETIVSTNEVTDNSTVRKRRRPQDDLLSQFMQVK